MWRYKLLMIILTPMLMAYTIFRAIKFKDYRYLLQRFCLIKFKHYNQEKPILIHAASVGEVIAVIPLIQKIIKEYPLVPIILTTNTTTSAEIFTTQLASTSNLQHYYLPIDWSWAVKRLLNTMKPRCIFIVETELWPNLFQISYKKNIPIVIINARLSHRTTSAKPWLLHIYNDILSKVTQILTRSSEDYESYLKLGANESKLKLIGNIKFSSNKNSNLDSIYIERPYVLAASTHDDEEMQLISIWMDLIKNKIVTTEILIIVPRHPERADTIAQMIKAQNINISIRSKNEKITNLTQVYIADTVGELKQFMMDAKFIFMGGSLIPHGGQNIIEPAQLEKAIIFGQHMFNFKDECKLLLDNNAAIQVNNKSELISSFTRLLQDPDKITQLSNSAVQIMQQQGSNILHRYMSEIKNYINPDL